MMAKAPDEAPEQRRAHRLERREHQRAQNGARALKMRTARLTDHRPQSSARQLGQAKQRLIHVGCSGWFYWHWRHCFYPVGSPTKDWFPYYASKFETVELNAPFYSWPTVANVNGWIRQAGRRRFVYTVKVCELITHVKRFIGTKRLVEDFYYVGHLLGPRMGCFLFQLPSSFHYSPARLRRILDQLDPRWRNVVEFRHRSWWNERVFDAFKESGVIFCSCSGPRLPDELVKTADDVYIRFHGTKRWYRHDYSKDELAVWAARIRASGAKRVWAYFNNDREGYAIKNARELRRQLVARATSP
jgi:uncharacterized protein YecE (DUF72 family)